MALNLDILLDDFNGTALAVAGTSEWGFIPNAWYLAIPDGLEIGDQYIIGNSMLVDANRKKAFIKANYKRVRPATNSNQEALFVAMLRYAIAERGILTSSLARRSVVENEYVQVNHAGENWDAAENNIPEIQEYHEIAKFTKRFAPYFVHQMVYVFAARGHHWQPNYNELYDRLKNACFIPTNPGFALPSNEVIYRLALHPFGVKPLYDLAIDDYNNGKMAAAMQMRYDPATPIAGVAHITTLKATLDTMKQESWWLVFEHKYHAKIEAIDAEVAKIHTNPTHYHVAAKVLGAPDRKFASVPAVDAFNVLAQFALGYIDHLGRRHSLNGQQAITKKSGGPRGIAEAFAKACDRFGKPDVEKASMDQFLSQL
jgi:hypothetical protein